MKIISILLLTLLIALIKADTCGGNCPSNTCPSCPCGTAANWIDIPSLCSRYGWGQSCCQCIVRNESGGNAHAMLFNTNDTWDVGAF